MMKSLGAILAGKAGRAGLVATLALIPLLPVSEFWITRLNYVGLAAIVALGLVLLTGVAGLTSFGQAAFVGLGAYTTAYLSTNMGVSPWLTLGAGIALTVVVALLLAVITLRMSGHFLPLATLAWGLSLYYGMSNIEALGKYEGIVGVPAISIGDFALDTGRRYYYLIWTVALLSAGALSRLLNSRPGRAIRALHGGQIMAEAMGVSTYRYKVLTFLFAAIVAALSGWLFAHYQRSINPTAFSLTKGIEYLFMAVLGGAGSVGGAFAGSVAVLAVEDRLQVVIPWLIGRTGSFETIVFGILIVTVLKYAPQGIWPTLVQVMLGGRSPLPLARPPADEPLPVDGRTYPSRGELLLKVAGLRKKFGGLVAVNDIGFDIRAGEIVGLIGPNGAGKSTTFDLVSGVQRATAGQVVFRNCAIAGLTSREIAAAGMSRTFQHVKLLPDMTVLENVALGAHMRGKCGAVRAIAGLDSREEAQLLREAERQLMRVGLQDHIYTLAGNLALGPQRLVEIARALTSHPALLLLDEPAAGLRLQEKKKLAAVLRQLRGDGLSMLLVEHDMHFVMNLTDRIVVMEFGTKLMEGAPKEIQESPKVRAAYLGVEH